MGLTDALRGFVGNGHRVTGDLPQDDLFELMSSSRRRRVVRFVHENGDTTLDAIATAIAALENDKRPQDVSSTERKRVYVSSYQCHLPKLAEHDVVEYDQDRGTVAPGANIEQCTALLERV